MMSPKASVSGWLSSVARPDEGYEALQSMLTGEYTEESTGARTIRQIGGKDRHSKVFTSKGPRDRRVRLSVSTAIRFYDLQDRLGLQQPSKAVEWLLLHCQPSINALPKLSSFQPRGSLFTPSLPASAPFFPPSFHESADQKFSSDGRTLLNGDSIQLLRNSHYSHARNPHIVADLDLHEFQKHSMSCCESSTSLNSLFETSLDHLLQAAVTRQAPALQFDSNCTFSTNSYSSRKGMAESMAGLSQACPRVQARNCVINTSNSNKPAINCTKKPRTDISAISEKVLGAVSFHQNSSAVDFNSRRLYGALPTSDRVPLRCDEMGIAAANYVSKSRNPSDFVSGMPWQDTETDHIDHMQTPPMQWLKVAPMAKPDSYLAQLPQMKNEINQFANVSLVRNSFMRSQSDHSFTTIRANLTDDILDDLCGRNWITGTDVVYHPETNDAMHI